MSSSFLGFHFAGTQLCHFNTGISSMERETVPIINFQKELEIRKITQILKGADPAFVSSLLNQARLWQQRKSVFRQQSE